MHQYALPKDFFQIFKYSFFDNQMHSVLLKKYFKFKYLSQQPIKTLLLGLIFNL